MKKYLLWLIFLFSFILLNISTYADITPVRINPSTFILDAQNDLWKIQVQWTYYVPTPWYEYDNVEWVKSQMLSWLDYDNEFYRTRHITTEVVNWTDAYKYIDWEKPIVIKSLSVLKSKLKWFLFAYRKPTWIFWMDGADFTEAFFSWYWSSSNQTVIIYPIKEKAWKNKWKLLWFIEYPCWNLVCRDSTCSDLIPKPVCWDWILNIAQWEQCDPKDPNTKKWCTDTCQWKELSCEVKVSSINYDQTKEITWISIKKDTDLDIKAVVINNKVYKWDNVLNDIKNIWKLPPWSYEVKAIWLNTYSNNYVTCNPWTLNVNNKEWCWDWIKNLEEQCDYNDKNSWLWKRCTKSCKLKDICWDGLKTWNEQCDYAIPWMENLCSKSCKLNDVTCKAVITPTTFSQWSSLQKDYFKIETVWQLLDNGYFNDLSMSLNSIYNKQLDICWTQEISFLVKNPYKDDGTIKKCSVKIKVTQKEFCWDWIVQKTEECDPKNWTNWIACESTCKLKKPSCNITDLLSSYQLWDNIVFGINNSSYWKVVSITSWTTKWSIISWSNLWNI